MVDAPDDTGPHTGALLDGRYRLEERIGEGATATVYRATDTQLHRTVAIKLLRGALDEAGLVQRARSETTLLASLNHHSLVTLFDARITDGGVSYLTMEYVEGTTLRQLIAAGPIEGGQAASIAVDLAEGLHAAHMAGVVHRDMKPSNVLLRRSPLPGRGWSAKIADFGIAYLRDSTRLTTPGIMVGTMAYVAPEQARGEIPTPAVDVYALGLMLIEMLTGRRPFGENEGIATVVARMHRPPDIPDEIDPAWRGLLRGMTATRPDDRPTALDVATAAAALAGRTAPVERSAEPTITQAAALATADIPTLVAPAASVPTAATAADGTTRPLPAPDLPQRRIRSRPKRRRIGVIVGSAAAAVLLAATAATVWANAPTPAPTKAVVEPSVPSPSPSTSVAAPPTSTVVEPANNGGSPGNGNAGTTNKGNGKGNPGKGKGKKP